MLDNLGFKKTFAKDLSYAALTAAFTLVGGCAAQSSPNLAEVPKHAPAKIMPATQIANAFWDELRAQEGDYDQIAIVKKHIEGLELGPSNMPDDRFERLALAEAAYLTFNVQPALDYFTSVSTGSDLIAEHATIRLMQIHNRALDNPDKTLEMMSVFYERFPPGERNIYGRYQQLNNFTKGYVENDEAEKAVSMLIDEIKMLPSNIPHKSFNLLAFYKEEIRASSRNTELNTMVREKLAGFKTRQSQWTTETGGISAYVALENTMPSWYWREQRIRAGETLRDGRKRQLDELIINMEKWLDG